MKSINRVLKSSLALLLMLSTLFGCEFVLPEEKPGTGSATDEIETDLVEKEPLRINGTSLSEYTVVYTRTAYSGSSEAQSYLIRQFTELYGMTPKTSTSTLDRYEILVGAIGGNQKIAAKYANQDAFIGVDGKKIYLLGVNYTCLCCAIDAFLAKATGDEGNKTITLTANEKVSVKKDSITVLSYNVQQDLEKTGRRSDCLSEMTASIKAEDPDVFGTQEDTSTISSYFKSNLTGYSCYTGTVGNYVYWKTAKYNVIEKGYQYLSDTPDVKSKYSGSNEYRAFTYLILQNKMSGKKFFFANIHTDYRATNEVRTKQLKALTNTIPKVNKDNLPVIILGDFNCTPTSDPIIEFQQDNLLFGLTSKVAKTKGDTGSTLVVSEFSTRDIYVFDMIFVSTDRINAQYYTAVNNIKNGKYPSDHLPVVAHLDLY